MDKEAEPLIVNLNDEAATDPTWVGPKAARLALLLQAGYAVPPAFGITVRGYQQGLTADLLAQLYTAFRALQANGADVVAVRSSAVAEDTETASYAGMQETVLGVTDETGLVQAVERVWNSYRADHAEQYRHRAKGEDAGIAVIVQQQVAATVAGVAFARNPLTGAHETVIEAVAGLGEALVSGQAEPQRFEKGKRTKKKGETAPLLSEHQLLEIGKLVEQVGKVFSAPQDVEWAYEGEQLWLLQSRPITTLQEDWFTTSVERDEWIWGAGFLNERFTLPVSPLGWTMVAEPLEILAFRGPLELLGGVDVEPPLLKLWQGHPYSRVDAWQRMYKLFPDWLLPEDAVRFFPNGDTTLRHAPRQPVYGFHLIGNAIRVLRQNWLATAPWENPKGWGQYERKQTAALVRLDFEVRQLGASATFVGQARDILRQSALLTDELLEYHRWSLLYADVFYSLLRRVLVARFGAEEGTRRTVALTTHVESPTTRMNQALNRLVTQVATVKTDVQAVAEGEPLPTNGAFWQAVARFLREYGHRFLSLDIYDAPWEADPQGFARLLLTLTPTEERAASSETHNGLIGLTRDYMRLREAQRFYWQRVMALQRRVIVRLGEWWTENGMLQNANDVFGLTWAELLNEIPDGKIAAQRMGRLAQLRREAALNPAWHYPDFLRGTTPLLMAHHESTLQGRPVSPGVARGQARIVTSPQDFGRVRQGDILVTFAPDPGWTPLFGTVAGMVTERGGQLSHGAVVAREYQLPAVSGIAGLLATIQEGEWLLVDGTKGLVVREG
jgi:phosphohistidine swiveling domain-containing protein